MVTYSFYETDSRVMRYAETLAQRGDEVEIFALGQPDSPKKEVVSGVTVHRLQDRLFNEKSRFTYVWRIGAFLTRASIQVTLNDWRKKYDLVHIHSVPDFLVFSAFWPRLRGTPILLDIRDILPEFYASKFGGSAGSMGFRFLRFAEALSARFASHVIIAGKEWQERLLSRSVQPGKTTVILNLPDRTIFVGSANRRPSNEECLLIYHGTLNPHQGLDLAVTAFARIRDRVPQARFHIYGDGPSKPEILSLIQQHHLENQVTVYDRKPVREIPAVLETAQLGIVPKRKDEFGNEAFSTKILEFMAMGVPVVVSDTKVDQHYFDDSLVRFFKGGSVQDLADCMLDLIQHPGKRSALAERAAEFVAQNDWAKGKQVYLDLVDKLTA